MAQQLQNITIAAPGFYGLNTQDSPVDQAPRFASIALNCIIDQYGRVGSRKGYEYITTSSTALASAGLSAIYEYTRKDTGAQVVLSAGNNKIFTGTATLVDATPGSPAITASNWKIVELNEHVYFWQRGHEPLVYSEHTGTVQKMSAHSHASGTAPQANEALAAFGKVFVADITGDKHTVYWSDTLDGASWTGGATGSIDVDTVWPRGNDEIVALAQHNNFLVIFGRRSILIYQGADTPSSMEIYDAIEGVGCIARDSVQNTGSDVLFLSENGVMSLGRVIQEKSSPMRDISKNVRNDITALIESETGNVRSAYSAEEAFYLVSFPTRGFVYCFDMRGILEDGSHRTTLWDNIEPLCFHVRRNGDLLMGHSDGVTRYTGYDDNTASYGMEYYSNPLAFGNATLLKFLKKLAFTIIGGSGAVVNMKWAFDYRANFSSRAYTLASGGVAEYNTAEFNEDEFTTGVIVTRPSTNTGGSGYVATIGLTSNINGASVSIQQIDILALLGRLI
jgi:hypothetical protein